MYENLKDTVIDKSNDDYKDFPDSTDGQVYISGNEKEGWRTRDNRTLDELKVLTRDQEAKQYLKDTDWYVTRFIETQTPIPEQIVQSRKEARERI